MKKILFFIILSMLIVPGASASEIFGQISTNPNAPAGNTNPPGEEPVPEPPANTIETPAANPGGGTVILPARNQQPGQPEEIQAAAPEVKPEILGVKIYPDGALLRGPDRKIYLIEGQVKKQIINLAELKKYRGRAILKATAEELSNYETRGHLDGELIRQKREVKVYVIKKGVKQHILNLEELRARYFGLEIFNISPEEMARY